MGCIATEIGEMRSVEEANYSLCVLSLPEVCGPGGKISIPRAVTDLHVSGKTFYLLNKTDLVGGYDVAERAKGCVEEMLGAEGCVWLASASSGSGMEPFLQGFSVAMHARYESVKCPLTAVDFIIQTGRERDQIRQRSPDHKRASSRADFRRCGISASILGNR